MFPPRAKSPDRKGPIGEKKEKKQESIPSLYLYRTSQYKANKNLRPTQDKTHAVLSRVGHESQTKPRNLSEVAAWVFPWRVSEPARAQGRGGAVGVWAWRRLSQGACQRGRSGGLPTPDRGVWPSFCEEGT